MEALMQVLGITNDAPKIVEMKNKLAVLRVALAPVATNLATDPDMAVILLGVAMNEARLHNCRVAGMVVLLAKIYGIQNMEVSWGDQSKLPKPGELKPMDDDAMVERLIQATAQTLEVSPSEIRQLRQAFKDALIMPPTQVPEKEPGENPPPSSDEKIH